jgi:hypothetical protein
VLRPRLFTNGQETIVCPDGGMTIIYDVLKQHEYDMYRGQRDELSDWAYKHIDWSSCVDDGIVSMSCTSAPWIV